MVSAVVPDVVNHGIVVVRDLALDYMVLDSVILVSPHYMAKVNGAIAEDEQPLTSKESKALDIPDNMDVAVFPGLAANHVKHDNVLFISPEMALKIISEGDEHHGA